MSNPDLDTIIASVDAAIRQAYALGRRDALDHVARWAQTEETTSTQLALVAPAPPAAPEPAAIGTSLPTAASDAVATRPSPQPPSSQVEGPPPRGFGALLRDFVYPSG